MKRNKTGIYEIVKKKKWYAYLGLLSFFQVNSKKLMAIIIMVIFKCYFSREHIFINNCVNIELGKTNRLKALRMMENHT